MRQEENAMKKRLSALLLALALCMGLLPGTALAGEPESGQDNDGPETPPENAVALTVNEKTYDSFK